jgi:ATP-binding cassette subfamily B protein RaxB
MVARHFGHDTDLNALRQRFSQSFTGMTLRHVMDVASQLGLSARALRAEITSLHLIQLPAILHWDLRHFVVLKSVNRRGALVYDPAIGARSLSWDELSDHFTGVVLELSPSANFEHISDRTPVRLHSLWSKSHGLVYAGIQILLLSVALQITALATPFFLQLAVDDGIDSSDSSFLRVLAFGFGFLIVIQAGLDALRTWCISVFGNVLTFQMVGNLVHHLLRVRPDFFARRHVGDILSRLGSTNAIQDTLTRGFVSALLDGVMAASLAIIMFIYSPTLASVVLISVVLSLIASFLLYPSLSRQIQERLVASGKEQSYLMETVRAANTIKILGREAQRESSWRNLYASVINSTVSAARTQTGITFVQNTIAGLQIVAVIYLGARQVVEGAGFSIGMLLAFLSFRQTFTDRCLSLTNQGLQFRLLSLHLDRLGDLVTAEPEVAGSESRSLAVSGRIAVQDLTFRYGTGEPVVLRHVSFEVEPGEFLAITGPSGGGKTTLLKLMLGLYYPEEGAISIEGQKATPALWRAWRTSVGVVAQDDRLLSGTIADNIAFFDPDLDMRKVQVAAEQAQIHQDVLRMPMQYEALIGDMGSSLSGGQRQRILLARALYRDPKVLFLDEGTANLDERTEEVIADLIQSLPITRVIVAHRPALIRRAGKVIELKDGIAAEASPSSAVARTLNPRSGSTSA